MPTSRTKKAAQSHPHCEGCMTALAMLRSTPRRAVIGERLRKTSAKETMKASGLSLRHTKALRSEEHDPHIETACRLARADHVIRAKIIVDCLPEDLALRVAHLRFDDFDDQIEFHRIVMRSLAGDLT